VQILVVHPGALGDIILSLPALRLLGDRFPGAQITLAADADFAAAVAGGYASRVLSLSSVPLHLLFGSDAVSETDERFWRSFDRIVSWTGSGAGSFAQRLARIHPCSLTVPWRPGRGESRHVSRIFADSLQPWLLPPSVMPALEIEVSSAALREAEVWLRDRGYSGARPLYVLHPGAGSPEKRWPAERFRELGSRLLVSGDLLIVEGPAEADAGGAVSRELGRRAHLAANLPLPLLAGIMSFGRVFVGNDSGIAHLGAGLGIPGIVLFGPTRPEHWSPVGKQVSVIRNVSGCAPCNTGSASPHTCMENIATDVVWQTILSHERHEHA
jgi:heptosyltransferase III